MNWLFPLKTNNVLPILNHPGAFGVSRKYDVHSGVDLYCSNNDKVYAVEDGTVIKIYAFTGSTINMPWWNDTDAIAIKGDSGIVIYGEISTHLKVGEKVKRGDYIANIKQVLPEGKERPDIPSHSLSMLHMTILDNNATLNRDGNYEDEWQLYEKKPQHLIDPTNYLLNSLVLDENDKVISLKCVTNER